MSVTVHHGDMLAVLPTLEADSVDSCVTDPPYLLEFMGKAWDRPDAAPIGLAPFEAWFAGFAAGEGCFRIQRHKDGRYYTCTFSIHLRADDAPVLLGLQKRLGGRIRFGDERTNASGVTSSPDVRWVVDARADCWRLARILDRAPMFAKKAQDYALWRRGLDLWTDTPKGSRWSAPRDVSEMERLHKALQDVKRYTAEVDLNFDPFMNPAQAFHYRWAKEVYRVLKPGAHLIAFGGSRTYHRLACAIEDAGFQIRDCILWITGSGFPKSRDLGNGWGTALKPAAEFAVLARKPLSEGTIAGNVLKHGTGALNIDASRIESGGEHMRGAVTTNQTRNAYGKQAPAFVATDHPAGRWPANVIHDGSDEVMEAFARFGEKTSGSGAVKRATAAGHKANAYGAESRPVGTPMLSHGDSGTAARFFYTAKADSADRLGSKHPTVKPVDLIAYLCRLVTPPGGLILDPFAGSGTLGMACMREGFNAVLVEREAEYVADINRRLAHVKGEDAPLFQGIA